MPFLQIFAALHAFTWKLLSQGLSNRVTQKDNRNMPAGQTSILIGQCCSQLLAKAAQANICYDLSSERNKSPNNRLQGPHFQDCCDNPNLETLEPWKYTGVPSKEATTNLVQSVTFVIFLHEQRFEQCSYNTSQELRMLSRVTLYCQETKTVKNSGSQLSE